MKHFTDYFNIFISYVKMKEGCPKFSTYKFIFRQQGNNNYYKEINDINEASIIFDSFFDKGHSWINIECEKIINDCLFVIFMISESKHDDLIGKTCVQFCGPYVNLNGEKKWA